MNANLTNRCFVNAPMHPSNVDKTAATITKNRVSGNRTKRINIKPKALQHERFSTVTPSVSCIAITTCRKEPAAYLYEYSCQKISRLTPGVFSNEETSLLAGTEELRKKIETKEVQYPGG